MERKIKKLSISARVGYFGLHKPNAIIEQSITIKRNGQVWWRAKRNLTEEEMAKDFSKNGITMTEYKNVGKERAERILQRAEELFKGKLDTEFHVLCNDAEPDVITIQYEDGKFYCGQLIDLTYNMDEIESFYEHLSQELLIDELLFFDD